MSVTPEQAAELAESLRTVASRPAFNPWASRVDLDAEPTKSPFHEGEGTPVEVGQVRLWPGHRSRWLVTYKPDLERASAHIRSKGGAYRYIPMLELRHWELVQPEVIHANRDGGRGVLCGEPIPADGTGLLAADAWSRATCPACNERIAAALEAGEVEL